MNLKSPVYTELAECQDCYKCIRKCPVKSIQVEKGRASVIAERCICCGRCVVNCPSYAKKYRKDVDKVKLLLSGGKKVMVSLAPSFAAEFSGWKPGGLIAALKQLGFSGVSETALGADFVSARIARDLAEPPAENGTPHFLISSACPSIVEYIKLYAPDLAPYITPHASPLLTHARFLRSHCGGETAVVFIGPCIAKKREADLYGTEIAAAITFQELAEWLEKERIRPESVSVSADCVFYPRRSARGAFFPIEGGEITAFSAYMSRAVEAAAGIHPQIETISVSGIQAVQDTLAGFNPASLTAPLFLELLACSGGCINGPGMAGTASGIIRGMRLRDYARSADRTLDAAALEGSPLIDAEYPAKLLPRTIHTEGEIAEALRGVGKFSLEDRLNCASCGYDSCRDFALALLDGRAEKAMCASYMRKLASKTANAIIRSTPNGIVIVDKDRKIIECNEQFAKLLGSDAEELFAAKPGLEGADLEKLSPFSMYFQPVLDPGGPEHTQCDHTLCARDNNKIYHLTLFAIEKGISAAAVVSDITEPRVRIDRTVERARELIQKNVSTVQQIAFLLGENAAESEAILDSIIESYTLGEKDA
ncbi:4Fe-4S ferredoxin [Spirochaetia bacterium]|nr:4Fe-4S ferredoxin [Spirochaetia bacterium]